MGPELLRLLPRIEHAGFSMSSAGTVACLRQEDDERSLILKPQSRPSRVLIHERSLGRAASEEDQIQPPVWAPSGERLAFSQDGVWVIREDGTGLEKLTDKRVHMPDGGRGANGDTNLYAEKNAYLTWMPDGRSLLFIAESEPDHVGLWQVDADGGYLRRLLDGARTIQSFAVSPSGDRIAVVTSDGIEGDLWLVHLNGQEVPSPRRRAKVHSEQLELGEHRLGHIYRYPKVVWGSDEDTVILRGAGTGWSKIYRVSIATGKMAALTDGEWEDGELVLSGDGARAVLSSRRDSPFDERLRLLDLESRVWEPLATPQVGVTMPVAWVGDTLYYTYSSPNRRGDLYAYDFASKTSERLTDSDEAFATVPVDVDVVEIPADAGRTPINALLYKPRQHPKNQELPGIVWCHGGPADPIQRDWGKHPAWLATEGFAVVVPAFRATAGLGRHHMEAGFAEAIGVADLDDVLTSAEWLRRQPGVDGRRLGIAGRSWGGYLTLRALTRPEHPFRCGWAGAAIADWEIQQAETEVRYYDLQLLGGFINDERILDRARDRSPVHAVGNLAVPLLITHGREDRDVPFRQIERFVEAARRVGAPLEEPVFSGEGHSNKQAGNIVMEHSCVGEFLRRHLCSWDLTSNPCGGQVVY